jgi:hypothetical protein
MMLLEEDISPWKKDRNGSTVEDVRVDADRHSAIAMGRLGKTSAVIRASSANFQ